MSHKPVLLQQVIEGLNVKDNDVFVDLTLGNAGHTEAVINTGAKNLTIIGIDADKEATNTAEKVLSKYPEHKIIIKTTYFDSLGEVLEQEQITKIDKVLIDLGFRSDQVDNPERGFSFQNEGPLLMTFKSGNDVDERTITAHEIINEWSEESLADIIYGFGEEQFSRRIARGIVEAREKSEIKTTTELAELIKKSVPFFYRHGKIHPATKTFQALRIAVNSELERLQRVLPVIFEKLNPKGRLAIISFHSLEDRIVKNFFRDRSKEGFATLLTKKPQIADKEEIINNPRSRSAKLRILEKN